MIDYGPINIRQDLVKKYYFIHLRWFDSKDCFNSFTHFKTFFSGIPIAPDFVPSKHFSALTKDLQRLRTNMKIPD
jgi:hypothetical protein